MRRLSRLSRVVLNCCRASIVSVDIPLVSLRIELSWLLVVVTEDTDSCIDRVVAVVVVVAVVESVVVVVGVVVVVVLVVVVVVVVVVAVVVVIYLFSIYYEET